MSLYLIDTKVIKNKLTELETYRKYFESKKSTFSPNAFNSTGKLTNYMVKIQGIYGDIATNIDTLKKYIEEYITDIESLENIMARHQGYVKAEGIYDELKKYKNLIENKYIGVGKIFEISSMVASSNNINSQYKFGVHSLEDAESIMDYIDEATNSYKMLGFVDADIKRLLVGEITVDELMAEIEKDPDRTRMRKVTEANNLISFTQGFKSMEELDEAIANLETQVQKLKDSSSEEDKANLEYFQSLLEGCKEIKELGVVGVVNLSDLENKRADLQKELSTLLNDPRLYYYYEVKNLYESIQGMMGSTSHSFGEYKNRYVAIKCTDKFGTEWYMYPGDPADFYKYESNDDITYEKMTLEQMYAGTDLYDEFLSALSKEEVYSMFEDGNVTIDIWKSTTTSDRFYNELQASYTGSKRMFDDYYSQNGAKINELQKQINNYDYVKTCVLEDTDHYMNFIDIAAKNEDYEEYSEFNEDILKSTSNLLNGDHMYIGTVNIINNKSQIVDLISCIINDKITISENGVISSNGRNIKVNDEKDLIEHYAKWAKCLTDDEKKAFNYIVNKEGYDKAYDYLQGISKKLDQEWCYKETKKDTEWAQKNWLNSTVASVGSVVVTPIEGIDAFFTSMSAEISGNELYLGDVYSHGLVWRDAVASKISEEHGATLAFLYSTGMSMIDSGLNLAINSAANFITGGSMSAVLSFAICSSLSGSRAYVSSINESLRNGVSQDKAILLAVSSAMVETAMEHCSMVHLTGLEGKLGNIASSLPSKLATALGNIPHADILVKASYILGSAISQGICEGEEEFTTEIVNYLLDYFILRDDSKFITSLEENGLEKTLQDLGQDAILAGLGGFISGGVFGGIHGITTVTKTSFALANNMYTELQGDTRAQQFASALNINQEQSVAYQELLNKYKNNGEISASDFELLQNGTILNQAGAQMKKNVSSAFASFGQKIYNGAVDFFENIKSKGRNIVSQLVVETGSNVAAKTDMYDASFTNDMVNKSNVTDGNITTKSDGIDASADPINGSTAEFIPIGSLYDILNSDEAYNNFLNMESDNKAKYANAIFQLLSLSNKTDLGLSSAATERANSIITGYSNLAPTISNMKSNPYIQMIANGMGDNVDYNAIFSSDIYKMRNFVKSYEELINLPGNEVLLNFKNNIDELIKNSIKQVVDDKAVLSSDSYGRFCSYLLYGDLYIDVPTVEYFNYMKSLGYKTEDNIQKIIDNYDYYNNEMIQELKDFFGRRFSIKELRQKLDKPIRYIPERLFDILYPGESWMGRNNGKGSIINLRYANEMNDVLSHESIHQVSANNKLLSLPKKLKNLLQSISGYTGDTDYEAFGLQVSIYDPKAKNYKDYFKGFNEAVTEYFTKQMHPKAKSGYDYNVSELDLLVKSGIFSMNILKNAYLNNDITLLAKHFKKILHLNDNSLFVSLLNAFDKVNSSKDIDVKNKAQKTLHKLIASITYSYANKSEVNLKGIDIEGVSNVNTSETTQGMQFDYPAYYDGQGINVTSDLDGQTYTIQLSFLTNILRDDYTYQAFLQSDYATQALYVKGLYQLINTSLGFELGLSAEDMQFGRDIINWFEQNQYSSVQNEYNLKQYLLNQVSNITDPVARARVLYMELNKLVHYDADFIAGSKDAKQQIYDAQDNVSLDSLEVNQRVVCKGWANLYYDLLIEAGFDSANVKLLVSDSNYSLAHKWVEIDLGDSIIIADATDAIYNSIDLVSAKTGLATNGFLYLPSSWSGTMIKEAIAKHQLTDEILENNKESLLQLDKYLGYANENGYFDEQLKASKELFGGSKLFQKIMKGLSPQTIIDRVLHLEVPSNLDGYEAFAYYKRILTNLFGDSIKFGYGTKYWQNGTSIEPIFVLDYQINSSSYIYAYSESLGQLYFDSYRSYLDYVSNLDLVK